MFEGYVTPLLKRLLNRYLHDVDVDQIPLLGGDIVITNVSLRVDVIQSLIPIPLPFEISSGVVKTLTVRIPWTGLQSSSIQVELNQVEVTLQPWETRRRRSSFGSTTSLPSTMSWPDDCTHRPSDASFSSAASASNVAHEEGSDASGNGGESWTMSLLSSLLHNISIDIKNAVLRFETPTCVLSLTFKQLLFTRTNESWQAAYSEPSGASKCCRSLVTATDVAVCVDPIINKRRHFEEPVISRVKVVVRMTQFGSPLLRGTDVDIDTFHIILSTLSMSLTTEQCSSLIDITAKLATSSASEGPSRANSVVAPPRIHSSDPGISLSPSPEKQRDKRLQQPSASGKKSGWLQSAWMLLQEEDATSELNYQGQPVPLVKAPAGSCLRISISKLSLRLRGPVGAGLSPGAIASTVFESSTLEFEQTTMLGVHSVKVNQVPAHASNILSSSHIGDSTCQSQILLSIGSAMIFGTTGCAVFDCIGTATSVVSPILHPSDLDTACGVFGPVYSALGGIRPSRERTARASSCSAIVFGRRSIWQIHDDGGGNASDILSPCSPAAAGEVLLHCSGMNISLQPQTVMFLQHFFSLVDFRPRDEDFTEIWQPAACPQAMAMQKETHTDWICSMVEATFTSLTNQLFWLDIGPCSVMLPFVPTPQNTSGFSLVAAMDRMHFVSSCFHSGSSESDHRDVLADFFASARAPMSLSINSGSFSLRLEHNTTTEVLRLLLPFGVQSIIMHKVDCSTVSASVSSLQVAFSERSMRQLQILWSVWLQQFFHLQSNFDHHQHAPSAWPFSATGSGPHDPGASSTDIRAQMLELHCSSSTKAVEIQLSLKAMEASGLITVVPAPLAPHIVEAPKHLFALFGKKVIGNPAGAVLDFPASNGGWAWRSSMGGCNIELLQHTMAPWEVFQGMALSYTKMANAAQRIGASDTNRGSPWQLRRSFALPNNASAARSVLHQHDDVAVDVPAQPNLDTRKENDSLRLLLGSYESHFARMRLQLQQLLPNGLISRDIDVLPFSSSKSTAASFSSSRLSSFFERICPVVFSRIRKRDAGPAVSVWFRSVRGASNRLLLLIVVYMACLHCLTAWLYLLCIGRSAPPLPSLKLPDVFRNK